MKIKNKISEFWNDRGNRRKIIISSIGVAIIVVGFIAMRLMFGGEEKEEATVTASPVKFYKSAIAYYSDHMAIITAYGRIKSNYKIDVYSEVTGMVVNTNPAFKVGNTFNSGAALIVLDDRETNLQLYQMKSDLMNAITSIMPDLKADYTDAFQKWNTYLENFNINGPLREIPDPESSQEKYFLASRNVYKLYYNIRNIELQIEKHVIRAPFTGSVTESLIDHGSLVRAGQKIGEFAGTGTYELVVAVPTHDIKFIVPGGEVEIYSSELDKTWKGFVTRIGNHIEQTTQTVQVFILTKGAEMKDGLYVKAVINGGELDNVVRIPRQALVNNDFVFTIQDSLLVKDYVKVMRLADRSAYVTGIEEGKIVVTEPVVDFSHVTKVAADLQGVIIDTIPKTTPN